jgi:hypothetical protein
MSTQTAKPQTAEPLTPPIPEVRIDNRPWTQEEIDRYHASLKDKREKRAARTCTQ